MSFIKDFDHGEDRLRVQLKPLVGDRYEVKVGPRVQEVTACRLPDGRVRFEYDGQIFDSAAAPNGGPGRKGDIHVSLGEQCWALHAHEGRRSGAHGVAGDGVIVAPMTGTVLEIRVRQGDRVAATDTVAVVTAMKMEHKLVAGIDGVVAEVRSSDGATVAQDELLLRIEPVE